MQFDKNHNKTMLERFKKYLIEKEYSEFTPSGKPSKVYDYIKRVEKITPQINSIKPTRLLKSSSKEKRQD